jgi:hypothetical protein
MTERSDYQTGNGTVAVIPYDTFEAANLFITTGRTPQEVLPLIGLSASEWDRLYETYQGFPTGDGERQRQQYFGGLDDAGICWLVLPPRWWLKEGDEPDLQSTWHIREAVRRNPRIGPFKNCPWSCTFIAEHPVAAPWSYTHDGARVYYNGKPLTNRKGEAIEVDAASFKAVGGRWLHDRHHVYGQGEYGANGTPYWYVVKDADAANFEALNLRYARDGKQAYYITRKTIRTKSPEAFEIVPRLKLNYRDGIREPMHDESILARDREAVYFYGTRLKYAKPQGFRDLGHGYATDGATVWFLDRKLIVADADAATFIVPGPGEPHVAGPHSSHAVTDRYRPYIDGEPCDPLEAVQAWRPFFEARTDLEDWWWHKIVNKTPREP